MIADKIAESDDHFPQFGHRLRCHQLLQMHFVVVMIIQNRYC
jgi:hypothetical protein